jgi:hypothetical protein
MTDGGPPVPRVVPKALAGDRSHQKIEGEAVLANDLQKRFGLIAGQIATMDRIEIEVLDFSFGPKMDSGASWIGRVKPMTIPRYNL